MRDELIQAIKLLCACGRTDEENGELALEIEKKVPHSGIIDLVFQDMRGLSIEQIVDEALQRETDYARQSGT